MLSTDSQMLLNLDEFIQHNSKMYRYHRKHIKLVRRYAYIINDRLGNKLSKKKLSYISLAHDLFKEVGLDPNRKDVIWNDHVIPQDTCRYVRTNLDVLEEYGLDEFFNTDVQYHALSAGIFVRTELGVTDEEILYPIFFHSCPVISIYKTLSPRVRMMIDVTTLADKLSSNYLRINYRERDVRIDLDQTVFGNSGMEFNYSLGLFLARLISQGKSEEKQSKIATEYYYNRLCEINPVISKTYSIKRLGEAKKWPKRKSQVLMH